MIHILETKSNDFWDNDQVLQSTIFFTTDLRYFPTLAEVALSSCGRNSTYFISQCSYLIYIESAHAWCIGFENVLYNLIWPLFSNLRGMKPFVTTSGGESLKLFLNCQQHKVDISVNHFFPFVSFVMFITVTHKFGRGCYLIF